MLPSQPQRRPGREEEVEVSGRGHGGGGGAEEAEEAGGEAGDEETGGEAGQSQVQPSPERTGESQDISQTFQEDLQAGEISRDLTAGVTIRAYLQGRRGHFSCRNSYLDTPEVKVLQCRLDRPGLEY